MGDRGFSLVEISVALGISGIVTLAVFAVIQSQSASSIQSTATITKLKLFAGLSSALRNRIALAQTANVVLHPANATTLFATCRNQTGTCAGSSLSTEFNLYDNSPVPAGGSLIAGPLASNIYFDVNGVLCAVHSQNCIFQTVVSMTTVCQNGGSICTAAEKLRVTFSVLPILPLLDREALRFKPISGAIDISVIPTGGSNPALPKSGSIPVWDNSLTLVPSALQVNLATAATIALPVQTVPPAVQPVLVVTGNTNFLSTDPLLPLNVLKQSSLEKPVRLCTDGVCSTGGNLKLTGFIISNDPSLQSYLSTQNLHVENNTGSPLMAHLWTGYLHVTGNIDCLNSAYAPVFLQSSDSSLKTNIRTLEDSHAQIEKLNPVSFRWQKTGKADLGFIAQEVSSVFPELVHQKADGYYTVSYLNMTAPLVSAITSHFDRISAQVDLTEQKINNLNRDLLLLENPGGN